MSENPWGESPYEPPPPPPFPPANSSWTDHDDSGWGAAASVTPPRLRTPSPVASSPSPPIPTFDALPPPRAITPPNHDDDDWGDHGNSPNLPTLPNFPPAPSHADDRDRDWPQQSEERDWKPPEIDSALPTFGQSFAPPKEANSREDRGWNDEPDLNWEGRAANLTLQDSTDDGEQGWEDHAAKQTSSIPAAYVEDLKTESSRFADTNWKVSSDSWDLESATHHETGGVLLEPPQPIVTPKSTIDSNTPLSSLFQLSPTIYPAFREGMEQTALKAAETLRGTTSSAYRHAKFGRPNVPRGSGSTSIVGQDPDQPVAGMFSQPTAQVSSPTRKTIGKAGDEFDLDAADRTPVVAKSWWSSAPKEEPVSPPPVPSTTSPPGTGDSAAPSTIGRFLGRFSRPATVSAVEPTTSRSNSPSSFVQEPISQPTQDWTGDIGFLDNTPTAAAATTKVYIDSNGQSTFSTFEEGKRTSSPLRKKAPVVTAFSSKDSDGFGGLMEGFGKASTVLQPRMKEKGKADIFDPFGDDVQATRIASLLLESTLVPTQRKDIKRSISPAIKPTIPAFSPPMTAPQPRLVNTVVQQQNELDSFDDFFSSAPKSSTTSLPPLSIPRASQPLRAAILSPPLRPSTISPPPSSSTPVRSINSPMSFDFAPPPPPSQPLNRGANKPVSVVPPVTIKPVVKAPPPKGTGKLNLDDLSFFESL